jgi:anti-sigma factor RsiW
VATGLPKDCLPFEEDLSALIDEELAPEREAEVRAHVDACSRCAARLGELCNVDLELAGLAPPAPSADLARGLAERIATDAEAPGPDPARDAEPPSPRTAPPRARRRWLGGASLVRIAAAAGLVLAAWLVLRGDDGVSPEPRLARTSPEERESPESVRERVPAPALPGEVVAVEPERPAARVPAPESDATVARGRRPAPDATSTGALPELPEEDLAMLLELQAVEDLDLIANLELLETLLDLERGAG